MTGHSFGLNGELGGGGGCHHQCAASKLGYQPGRLRTAAWGREGGDSHRPPKPRLTLSSLPIFNPLRKALSHLCISRTTLGGDIEFLTADETLSKNILKRYNVGILHPLKKAEL